MKNYYHLFFIYFMEQLITILNKLSNVVILINCLDNK